ncbi:hemin import ATP-binding protein HmuV [Terrihabitans soli]|uniref:Hemin import ATP-binding protein HmuV n=1 Tax=Terrihabitans soli TaxID=708113 RepID=A0A6S6QYP2_9HYPH|nr:heme ABC transporter ATP-binding protein [Terrihabitans soli]BCJ92200.1 hemin import ATP-binding protein HmuV [Terrihabitans soli]
MFEIDNISVRFGSREILKSVSARVAPGRLTVIAGPNGAGKSTVLKVMTGELKPNSGHVRFEDRALSSLSARIIAERRAVLPQSSALAFPFTVFEVVRLGLQNRGGLKPHERRTIPLAALEQVDLRGFGARHYQELSGGEQQRVHLARVMCQIGAPVIGGRPQYLFLDEPTSSLDIRHQIETLNIARQFARDGGGVLAILHDLNLAASYADHLIVMHRGAVAAEGAPAETITDALLEEVFGLPLRVGRAPAAGTPFVLPQSLLS